MKWHNDLAQHCVLRRVFHRIFNLLHLLRASQLFSTLYFTAMLHKKTSLWNTSEMCSIDFCGSVFKPPESIDQPWSHVCRVHLKKPMKVRETQERSGGWWEISVRPPTFYHCSISSRSYSIFMTIFMTRSVFMLSLKCFSQVKVRGDVCCEYKRKKVLRQWTHVPYLSHTVVTS